MATCICNNFNFENNSTKSKYNNKRFFARKIHKIKKILRWMVKSNCQEEVYDNDYNTRLEEIIQNQQNELREKEIEQDEWKDWDWPIVDENEQNELNENEENYLNYLRKTHENEQNEWNERKIWENERKTKYENEQNEKKIWENEQNNWNENLENCANERNVGICLVFMPGEKEPIAVKLRSNKYPGGLIWVSYVNGADRDICSNNHISSTSDQFPQRQFSPSIIV